MAKQQSAIGTSVSEHMESKRSRSARYRDAQERLAPFEQIARIVVMRRSQLGLSQQEVAERMSTTASVISRIEGGQHRTSTETLRRLAEALEGHALLGFEFADEGEPRREVVAL